MTRRAVVIGHLSPHGNLRDTYAIVGRPIALTSLALGLGFSTLAFSEFQSVAIMGAATAVTLAVAFLFDLLVLPSLLVWVGFKRI